MISLLLTRWRFGIGLAAALALAGLIGALAHYRHAYHAEQARYAALVASVEAQRVQATKDQQVANHALAAASQTIAEKSNAQAPAYYADVRAAALRMRADNSSCSSPASVPGTDHAAPVDDGSAPAPGMVSRPQADDDLLVAAAARAAQMHADAEALIASGAAINQP
jgi:hypothetical protein